MNAVDDPPDEEGSWKRINDGPWEKVEMDATPCASPGCGHAKSIHAGQKHLGSCNGSVYGGYSSRECFCTRFSKPSQTKKGCVK